MAHSRRDAVPETKLERRAFLGGAASFPFLSLLSSSQAHAQHKTRPPSSPLAGVITRQTQPANLEFPFASLDSFVTPVEQFFVRSHFKVPDLKASQWKLKVEGHVEHPFEMGYDELLKMAPRTMTALLECSGNSRVFLKPPQVGIRWEQGAVGNAEWTGVPLGALLDRAGVKPGAIDVILEGYDKGEFDSPEQKTPGEIQFARSLPLEKARGPEVLLAYRMNEKDLVPAHGFPVRAVVGGWYGMASVKWLQRILVTDRPYHGYFQTLTYSIWERNDGEPPTLTPVTEIGVKAQIARPMRNEVVPAASEYRVFGAAWSGSTEIRQVEISTDGGQGWETARLDERSAPFSWRFFHHAWRTPSHQGRRVLMARATDARPRVQPMHRDENLRDAAITHVQPIEVFVANL